jgi:hypothetical protein
LQSGADRGDDLLLRREVALLLGHHLAVQLDDERAWRSHLQLGLEAKLLLQRSRRTGSSGFVASGVAVLDGDHERRIPVERRARHQGRIESLSGDIPVSW